MSETVVTIERLAGLGDGVADRDGARLHVPLAAPGDRVRIGPATKGRAEILEVLEPGPTRRDPPCRHYGRCGGCALQHLDADFIAAWKREIVVAALAREGVRDVSVGPTITIPPGTRRRATLAARRVGRSVVLGFAERRAHRLVDLAECPVLVPALGRLIAPLRQLMLALLVDRDEADIGLTDTETGVDCTIIRKRPLTLIDRERLATFAEDHDLARIGWQPAAGREGEPVAARRSPALRMGGRLVAVPAGIFLQPSAAGEAVLVEQVRRALTGCGYPLVDLFSGLGTFALPLAAEGPVTAYDDDGAAIRVLGALPGRPVAAERRDLFREPLTPAELGRFRAAVIDPPRAGADAQSRALADSAVEAVAYVSCNPASFARDAAILVAGGFTLDECTPVDQFAWSPHTELVASFHRS